MKFLLGADETCRTPLQKNCCNTDLKPKTTKSAPHMMPTQIIQLPSFAAVLLLLLLPPPPLWYRRSHHQGLPPQPPPPSPPIFLVKPLNHMAQLDAITLASCPCLYRGGEIVNRHMEIVDLFFWRSPKVWFWFWALFYDLDTIWVVFGYLGLGALFLVQKGGPKRTTCRYTI